MGISVKKTTFISQILYKLMLLVYVNCSCTHVDLTCECSTPVVFCFFFSNKKLTDVHCLYDSNNFGVL